MTHASEQPVPKVVLLANLARSCEDKNEIWMQFIDWVEALNSAKNNVVPLATLHNNDNDR